MKTWLVSVAVGSLIGLALPAFGAKPDKTPEPSADVVFPAGLACPSFDVRIQTEARGFVKVFASGVVQSTGYERAWVTNQSTLEQIELIANGRVRVVFDSSGVGELVITGPQIIVFFPGDAGPGDQSAARTYYFRGNARIVIDQNFTFFEFAFSGTSIDLCAALS